MMNRYNVEAWTCFVVFMLAMKLGDHLAGLWGVFAVVILALGILNWAARHKYLDRFRTRDQVAHGSSFQTNAPSSSGGSSSGE